MGPFHWNCAVLGIGKELIVVHHLHHSDLLWKKNRECSRDPFAAHSEAFKPCSKQRSTAALNQTLRILPTAPCAKCECAWQPPPHLLFQLHPSCGSCLHLTNVKTKTSFCSDCYDMTAMKSSRGVFPCAAFGDPAQGLTKVAASAPCKLEGRLGGPNWLRNPAGDHWYLPA